jgi:hypothetical protein
VGAPRVYHRGVLLKQLWPILVLAAGLRLWGIGFGLPNTDTRPDEGTVVGTAAGMVLRGSLDPGFFSYPTLYIYVLGGIYAAGCAAAVAAGSFPDAAACLDADAELILAGRIVSALSGVAAIALTFAIARRLHRAAGVPAAAFLAVAFLHVRDSHFAVTDVPMTSMLLLALLLLLRADEQPSVRRFALAGLATGLAASTKYNAAMLAATAAASQAAVFFERGAPPLKHTRLLIFSAAAVAGFLLGTPYALLTPAAFKRDVMFESWHLMNAHRGISVDVGWRHHALVTLPNGMGWPLLAAGAAGTLWSLTRTPRRACIVFAFPLVYYAVAGRGQTVFARYMIPIVPFICLGAAVLIARAHEILAVRSRGLAHAAAAVAVLVCGVPTALKAMQLDRLLRRTDSRVLAAEWVAARVEPGASLLMTGGGFRLHPHPKQPPPRVWLWNMEPHRLAGPASERPDWIVVEESPLRAWSKLPGELQPVLEEYALRHTIRAVREREGRVYDQQDAFYLPLDGFDAVGRPGPNFLFFERLSGSNPR